MCEQYLCIHLFIDVVKTDLEYDVHKVIKAYQEGTKIKFIMQWILKDGTIEDGDEPAESFMDDPRNSQLVRRTNDS